MLFDQMCGEYQINYSLIEGTLLASLINHDSIALNDDTDLITPDGERARFVQAFEQLNQTLSRLYLMEYKDMLGIIEMAVNTTKY